MGQSYSNNNASPEPSSTEIEFKWRNDIYEYDTSSFLENHSKMPFFREDLELLLDRLSRLSCFEKSSEPSMLLSVMLVLLLNVVPVYFFIDWNVRTNGKFLWILSLLPIYIGLNALLPMFLNFLQKKIARSGKETRHKQISDLLMRLNDDFFAKRGIAANHNEENFSIRITRR